MLRTDTLAPRDVLWRRGFWTSSKKPAVCSILYFWFLAEQNHLFKICSSSSAEQCRNRNQHLCIWKVYSLFRKVSCIFLAPTGDRDFETLSCFSRNGKYSFYIWFLKIISLWSFLELWEDEFKIWGESHFYNDPFLLSMQGFYFQITLIIKKRERTLEYFLNLHIFLYTDTQTRNFTIPPAE